MVPPGSITPGAAEMETSEGVRTPTRALRAGRSRGAAEEGEPVGRRLLRVDAEDHAAEAVGAGGAGEAPLVGTGRPRGEDDPPAARVGPAGEELAADHGAGAERP